MESLSRRAHQTINLQDKLGQTFISYIRNPYNKDLNKGGVINMGASENKVSEDLLLEKINGILAKGVDRRSLYYFDFKGMKVLRTAITSLLTSTLQLEKPIDSENLIVCSGVISAVSILAKALADENDTFLAIGPCYGRFENDIAETAHVNFRAVPMWQENAEFGQQGTLRVSTLNESLMQAEQEGQKVKAVIITNPNNPTGQIHTKEEILEILNYCKERKLHVIMDEIYALSIHSGGKFVSSFQLELPDPDRTHILWGLSKDFGLSGFRCGVIHTDNPDVLKYIRIAASFSSVPAIVQTLLTDLLSDLDWINNTFLPETRRRIEDHFRLARSVLSSLEIPFYPAQGGLYLWVDLQKYLTEKTQQCEMELFHTLIGQGLYFLPGCVLFCPEPGWFRVVITMDTDTLKEGLKRLEKYFSSWGQNANKTS